MAANKDNETLRERSGLLVDGLAQAAISHLSSGELKGRTERLDEGAELLLRSVLSHSPFRKDVVCAELEALRVNRVDIIDYCIPAAAARLGTGWLEDELTFVSVSTASARLFGLCKDVAQDWRNHASDENGHALLLATIGREDHIVGPAVLTEQLRRQGHSVFTLLNTSAAGIFQRLRAAEHDAVLISVASFRSLDLAMDAIKTLKTEGVSVPVILGGAILDVGEKTEKITGKITGPDLVTKNIDTALAFIAETCAQTAGV